MFANKLYFLVAVSCVLALQVRQTDAQEDPNFGKTWNYSDSSEWPRTWPECGGRRQSPIDIDPSNTTLPSEPVLNLNFVAYNNTPDNMTIVNIGNEVMIRLHYPVSQNPHMEGGSFRDHYIVKQLHFHWGPSDDGGSEHTVGGHRYPLEMHILHVRREYFCDEDVAFQRPDGYLTVARFFNVTTTENPAFSFLDDYLSQLTEPGKAIAMKPFPVSVFNFYNNEDYWIYLGSLPEPNCAEAVTWIIPTTPLYIGERQLEKFRAIKSWSDDSPNSRPTQPLNGRTVTYVTYNDRQGTTEFDPSI